MDKSKEQETAKDVQETTKQAETATPETDTTSKEQNVEDTKESISDKRLRGQIAELQRQRDKQQQELDTFKQGLAKVVGVEDKPQEITVEVLAEQIADLKSQLSDSNRELAKSSYIDGLDLPDNTRQLLKKRIPSTVEDLEGEVQSFLADLNMATEEIVKTHTATEDRPLGAGASSFSSRASSANEILDNQDEWLKSKGLA